LLKQILAASQNLFDLQNVSLYLPALVAGRKCQCEGRLQKPYRKVMQQITACWVNVIMNAVWCEVKTRNYPVAEIARSFTRALERRPSKGIVRFAIQSLQPAP
jgi:hypothetical protein